MRFCKKRKLLLLSCLLLMGMGSWIARPSRVLAQEEETREEEYIPETYNDPIQSNSLPGWPQGPKIQAAAGIVMDLDTGAVVYAKNISDRHYPASITKIMTTLIALEQGNLEEEITCGEEVYAIEEDSSNLGIQPGEKVTLRQALYGLMLESANDLGNAIAVHVAGSVEAFADLMNRKAQELGCTNTHFVNPHGLHDEDHYTCALDMARIAREAYKNDLFREIASAKESMIPATNVTEEERYFANHQRLLQPSSEYYQEWCTGGKTGFTSDAWNTLVTYGEKNGLRYVCVLLRENGLDKAYTETTSLMNYGFEQFVRVKATNGISSRTFYDILALRYPSDAVYRMPWLDRKTVRIKRDGLATLPVGMDGSKLSAEPVQGKKGRVRYLYSGLEVGYGHFRFRKYPSSIAILPFEHDRDMPALLKLSAEVKKNRELRQTAVTAWTRLADTGAWVMKKTNTYVKDNRLTVLLAGGFVLLILGILITILILRQTREYRIQRRREQEERALLKKAEEIDRKSAQEIEKELRQAMEEERLRREEEEKKRASREEEQAKLQEMERLLGEIRNEHFDVQGNVEDIDEGGSVK